MNIRKNIDYTDMYAALDSAMEKNLSQVKLYYEIGRAVCQRPEKGVAVAAATYLRGRYSDVQGFSPRYITITLCTAYQLPYKLNRPGRSPGAGSQA